MEIDSDWIEWKEQKRMMIGHSAYFDRFMHLWNLLSRSNFYASCLLTIIEQKQKKRLKPASKKKKQKRKDKPDKTDPVVKSVMDELINSVVEVNAEECKKTSMSTFPTSDVGFVNELLEPAVDIKVENFSSESDSVSTALTTESYANSEPGDLEDAKYTIKQPQLTEDDYRLDLLKRRGVTTPMEDPVSSLDKHNVTSDNPLNSPLMEQPGDALLDDEGSDLQYTHPGAELPEKLETDEVLHNILDSQISIKSERMESDDKFPTTEAKIDSIENQDGLKVEETEESGGNNSQTLQPEKVPCPICNRRYVINSINKHLDICANQTVVKASLRKNAGPTLCLGRKTRGGRPKTHLEVSAMEQGNKNTRKLVKTEKIEKAEFPTSDKSVTGNMRRREKGGHGTTINAREEGEIKSGEVFTSGKKKGKITKIAASLFGTRHIRTRNSRILSPSSNSIRTNLEATTSPKLINTENQTEPNLLSKKSEKKVEEIKGQTGLQNIKNALEKTIFVTKTVNDQLFAEAQEAVLKLEAEKIRKEKLETDKKLDEIKSPPRKTLKLIKEKSPRTPSNNAAQNKMDESKNNKNDAKQKNLTGTLDNNGFETNKSNVEDRPKIQLKLPQQIINLPAIVDKCSVDESSSDSENAEIEIPAAPTRRSTRTTRSRISYHEAESNESEDSETQVAKKMKSSQKMTQKITKKSDDEYDPTVEKIPNISSQESKSETSKAEKPILEEEGELGTNKIDVEELLEKRFYKPDVRSFNNFVTNLDGRRYIHGELVDSSQPKLLIGGILREYQIIGYQWLKILYENGESGILADEMGLGKTIQCIAMICKLIQMKITGPFLVCAPTTTINNWFSEFKRFAPQVSVLLYYGSAMERVHLVDCLIDQTNLKSPLVVITSYEILMRDLPVLRTYNWSYLVLDEGHRVKNIHGKTLKDIKVLSTEGKVMLTGTPLQNNLTELWSLLNFLFPEVFDDVKSFQGWFDLDLLKKDDKILSMLHQVLTPFLLRRVKADVDIKIPPKREMLVYAPLAPLQDQYYRAVVDKSIVQLIKNQEYYDVTPGVADPDQIASNSQEEKKATRTTRSCLKQKYGLTADDFAVNVTLSNMMMLLRKCCNHPYLVHHPLDANTQDPKVDMSLVTSCGKMMLLDRMLPCLKKAGHKVLLFSQMTSMLDIIEDFCKLRDHSFVRFDGTTRCEDRVEYIDEFNNNPSIFIFLLSTRAGGIGINLTGADTVIIYDSDWNPQNDIQAQDRCHRIGQEKPVVVYRLVTASTIDQQIMERAARKRVLEKMIIHESKFKGGLDQEINNLKTISPTNLLDLLENTHCNRNRVDVIDDVELQKLLDRSDMRCVGDSPTPKPHLVSPRSDERKFGVGKLESGSSGCTVIKPRPFQVIEETKKKLSF